MNDLLRGTVVNVDLEPTRGSETGKRRPAIVVTNDIYNARLPILQVVPVTGWSEKKAAIKTNVVLHPTEDNGLDKLSIADCLQTRPVDRRYRILAIRGRLSLHDLARVDAALRLLFSL